MINRAKLRGKPLDSDCKQAHRTTHECGMKDDRVYCYGLLEGMSEWQIKEKCRKCGAYIDNITPLEGDAK